MEEYIWEFEGNIYHFDKQDDKDKYVVFTCAKNENDYIIEFIEHYLKLGFDKIIIADNNDDDSLFEILEPYFELNVVQVFNVHGIKEYQCQIYTMFMNYGNYKWCGYYDVDEFLELSATNNVKKLLDKIEEECFSLNWVIYGSNGEYVKKEGYVQDRFKRPVMPLSQCKENMFIKSLVKGGPKRGYFNHSHFPIFEKEDGYKYNICGCRIVSEMDKQVFYPLDYRLGYIKHYYTKSFEEYILKTKRGWPDGNDNHTLRDINHFYMFESNFKINLQGMSNSLFSHVEVSDFFKNAANDYDVIFLFSPNNNYYALYGAVGELCASNSGINIVVSYDIEGSAFTDFMEMAMLTGNRIKTIYDMEDQNERWHLFNEVKNGKYDTYFMITVS